MGKQDIRGLSIGMVTDKSQPGIATKEAFRTMRETFQNETKGIRVALFLQWISFCFRAYLKLLNIRFPWDVSVGIMLVDLTFLIKQNLNTIHRSYGLDKNAYWDMVIPQVLHFLIMFFLTTSSYI